MYQLKFKNQSKGPLWLVEPHYTLGAASDCEIPIHKSGVAAQAAYIHVSQATVKIESLVEDGSVKKNGAPIIGEETLASGDVFSIAGVEFEIIDPKHQRATASSQPTEAKQDWALVALSSALSNKRYTIKDTKILGRSKECDISLGVAHLSRKHASLSVTDQGLSVSDLGSSNGTYVNGQKIERAVLRNGDELGFDTLKFRVEGPSENLDSTTVRPVFKVMNEAPTLLGHGRKAGQGSAEGKPAATGGAQSPRPAKPKKSSAAAQYKVSAQSQPVVAKNGNSIWPLVILAAAAAVGLVWFFVFN
ncbi:FHA domain-containing protein [Teredinibacter sp. KSP-S5-2]|uniref:FHA domain-containing protein n=1 Tax=Teredinibacter sp. KSP-S5-2 TaxID=3034506 RepID=UPI00293487DB|nr:FHA domain-containing protein [Teredinibacter sp. KSP-S5-2]WNO11210.1 FHA domain-containing protein [Teredinibacter sp. KSP-S5-2]